MRIRMESTRGKKSFRKENRNQIDSSRAMIIPMSGARKINIPVCRIMPVFTELIPACAIAAPANPPIRVCEEEDGIPNHQVSRFQIMAAIMPAKISGSVIFSLWTVLDIVEATLKSVKMYKATKLKKPPKELPGRE